MLNKIFAAVLALVLATPPAFGQNATGNEFATATPGKTVIGAVQMCVDPVSSISAPCSTSTPAGYSSAATPVAANANGTTASVVGTLPAAAGKTTYVCGFDVSAVGGTAQIPITLSGLKGPTTFTYQMSSSASGAVLMRTFTPCVPANAANGAITVTTGAATGATAVNVNAYGYQQ